MFTSFESEASPNWELSASMWWRNGKDKVLLIQLARITSGIKRHIKVYEHNCVKLKVRAWSIELNYKNNHELAYRKKKSQKHDIPFSKIQLLLRSVTKQKFCVRGFIWMETFLERHLEVYTEDLFGKPYKRDWMAKVVFLIPWNASNFRRPLQSLLLRYTAENALVT